eukprot:5326625-Pleurochrysis_carterae.AAC.1
MSSSRAWDSASDSDDPAAAASAMEELLKQHSKPVSDFQFSPNEQSLLDDLRNASDGSCASGAESVGDNGGYDHPTPSECGECDESLAPAATAKQSEVPRSVDLTSDGRGGYDREGRRK